MNSKERILVVDDDETLLDLLCRMLTRLGYEAIPAKDGRDALGIFTRVNGVQLVLTDINMPHIDGWELAAAIRAYSPGIPIIAITGEGADLIAPQLRGSAVNHVIFKPFGLEQLRDSLSYAMAS